MGKQTGIAWTDHTVSPVIGCEKVSPGCKNCYAREQTPARVLRARGLETWGPAETTARNETQGWLSSLRALDRKAGRDGVRRRVFIESQGDPFEAHPTWDDVRPRLFVALAALENLAAQVLTKRPENILRMAPPSWLDRWPAHVWIGTTVEDQENAALRIPHLLRVPAAVRFLSVEPQIGPVDLRVFLGDALLPDGRVSRGVQWVIQGGESGSKARPFDLAWARALRDQCKAAGVAYFLKQLGARPVGTWEATRPSAYPQQENLRIEDSHGGDETEWPEDLRGCRAFPR